MEGERQLKPRGVGDTLGEIFAVFVANWSTILGVVAAVTVPVLIVSSIVSRNIIDYDALANDQLVFDSSAVRNSLIVSLFTFAANALAAGAVVHAVAGAYVGERSDIGGSISFAASHLGSLIVGSLLWSIGLAFGFVLLIIPGVVLAVGWVAWASAMLIEDLGAVDALKRSWQLTANRKWQVLGVGIGLFVLAFIISSIISSIAGGLGQEALQPPSFNTTVLTIIGNVITSAIFSTATVVVYLELRSRKEGPEVVAAALQAKFQPGIAGGTVDDMFR